MTKDPKEHEERMEYQSEEMISTFERMGVQVLLCTGNHHRKLANLDFRFIKISSDLQVFQKHYFENAFYFLITLQHSKNRQIPIDKSIAIYLVI